MSTPSNDLLGLAQDVLDDANLPPPVAARAAALLGRQAVEAALAALWRDRGATVDGPDVASFRAQLLALRDVDAELEARTTGVWWQLTRVCHHHPYELTPAREEIAALLADALGSVGALEARC